MTLTSLEIESLKRQLNYIILTYGRPLPNKSGMLREIENRGKEREGEGEEGKGGERRGQEEKTGEGSRMF